MKKPVKNKEKNLKLHCSYDLCELIQSRYDENNNTFNISIDGSPKEIKVSNPTAGVSVYLESANWLKENVLSFKGKTLYLFDTFPIPAQSAYEASKKMCTRYKNIFIEFA
jgi:hypothetical protein